MSEYTWTEISLETVGCILLLVLAYKVYRMRLTTESDCCGGAVHVEAENPGNEPLRVLRGVTGEGESSQGVLTLEDLEKLVQAKLSRSTNLSTEDPPPIHAIQRLGTRPPPNHPRPLPLQTKPDSDNSV